MSGQLRMKANRYPARKSRQVGFSLASFHFRQYKNTRHFMKSKRRLGIVLVVGLSFCASGLIVTGVHIEKSIRAGIWTLLSG